MECSLCKQTKQITKDNRCSSLQCDLCRNTYCQECSELSASELKCIPLQKRLLKFHCKKCRNYELVDSLKECIKDKDAIIIAKDEIIQLLREKLKKYESEAKKSSVNIQSSYKDNMSNQETLKHKADENIQMIVNKQQQVMSDLINLTNDSTNKRIDIFDTKMENGLTTKEDNREGRSQNHLEGKKQRQRIVDRKNDKGSGTTSFKGQTVNKGKIWLYISKVPDDVSEEDIHQYIKARANDANLQDCEIKKLPIATTKPNNQSYMVGVDFKLKENVYMSNFWPKKILFERFDFRRGKRFLQANTEQETSAAQSNTFLEKCPQIPK